MDELDRLLIERACERLCVDYARRVDASQDSFADLFTEDATLALSGQVLRGRGEILEFVRSRATATRVRRHLCLNIAVDVLSAEEARGAVELVYFHGQPDARGLVRAARLQPQAIGTYHDVYRRTDGGWRIAERRIRPAFVQAEQA